MTKIQTFHFIQGEKDYQKKIRAQSTEAPKCSDNRELSASKNDCALARAFKTAAQKRSCRLRLLKRTCTF